MQRVKIEVRLVTYTNLYHLYQQVQPTRFSSSTCFRRKPFVKFGQN